MLRFVLSTFVIVGLATGYPQGYGGVQPVRAPVKQVSSSVQCRTEYATIWDTIYQETETQECVTKYDNVCPQPDKSATQCMRSSARPFTRTCVLTSTELSMSLTQRPSAPPSTRRTANTNGRATETTRSGHQSPEHARATPTMCARM